MATKKNNFISAVLISAVLCPIGMLSAEAVSEKAKYKRAEALDGIIFLEVPMKNFGGQKEALKTSYEEIKKKYGVALGFYFEENFVEAYRLFLEVQTELEKLYEDVSLSYIDRTAQILQMAGKEASEVEVTFNRKNYWVKKVSKDVEITKDPEVMKKRRLYDPQEHHFIFDKKAISDNLAKGYSMLGEAKLFRQQAVDLEKWLETRKDTKTKKEEVPAVPPSMKKARLEAYMKVISHCRQAKVNAIRVLQLSRIYNNYTVQKDLKDNIHANEKNLDPVFDSSIPEQFRIDATDSQNKIFDSELRIKVKGESPVQVAKDERGKKEEKKEEKKNP